MFVSSSHDSHPRPAWATRVACVLISSGIATAYAAIPRNLEDITYQSADWGREQLQLRGYTLIQSDHHHGKRVEYWWGHGSKTCIKATASEGKIQDLSSTARTDCNQYDKASTKDDEAAAIAIGAAAILGAAALAHESHQRDGKHGDNSASVADFDRGFRDGKYGQPYHNYGNAAAYADGYTAGNQEREEQTQYRPRNGAYSGYQPYVALDDLVDARASSADSELRARGFRDTGGYKQGDRSFVTWHNGRTHQCVQAVTRDGRIKRLDTIDENNCL